MNFETYESGLLEQMEKERVKIAQCPICGGRGWNYLPPIEPVLGVKLGGWKETCECAARLETLEGVLETLKSRMNACAEFVPENCRRTIMKMDFQGARQDFFEGKQNVFFYGGVGTGKTTTAVFYSVYGRVFLDRKFYLAKFSEFSKPFGDEYEREKRLMKQFPVLILDDFALGKVNEYVLPHLFDVVDFRYAHGKHTIFTTNTGSREEIEKRVGEAITDRIFESCKIIGMEGESRRRKK